MKAFKKMSTHANSMTYTVKNEKEFKLCLNNKTKDTFNKIRNEAARMNVPVSALLMAYAERGIEKKHDVDKQEVMGNPLIPSLDKYKKNGIGGKNIVDAIRKGILNKYEATEIIAGAHFIVTEVTQSANVGRLAGKFNTVFDIIKSKRNIERMKTRVEGFCGKVKELVEEIVPKPKIDIVIDKSVDIDENEYEILGYEVKPKFLQKYNLPYDPPGGPPKHRIKLAETKYVY